MLTLKNKAQSEIPTPAEGTSSLFPNSDDNNELYQKLPDGTFVKIGSSSPGVSTIPLSNTVWVNTSLSSDVSSSRIFKNFDNALSWIITNGSPASDNLWQIILPAGNIGDITLSNKYIRLVGAGNTTIENLYSSIDYSAGEFKLFSLDNIIINNISIDTDKFVSCFNCLIYNITAADEDTAYFYAENCFIIGGDFKYIECGFNYWQRNFFISYISTIENLHGTFNFCTFKCADYENKISFLITEGETNIFNNCILDDIILEKSFENSAEISFNKCILESICLENNITFNLFNSNCSEASFADETNTCLNLYSSDVTTISGSGHIITDGYSRHLLKIGEINAADFNACDGNLVKISFSNAIPDNYYIEDIFYKFFEKFMSYSAGYSGITISSIEDIRTPSIINEVNNVIVSNSQMQSSNSSDIEIKITLSGENPKDWISGSISVYAYFRSIPSSKLI